MSRLVSELPSDGAGELTIEPREELLGAVVGVDDDGAMSRKVESVVES